MAMGDFVGVNKITSSHFELTYQYSLSSCKSPNQSPIVPPSPSSPDRIPHDSHTFSYSSVIFSVNVCCLER